MSITAEQYARTVTGAFDFRLRFFIGGQHGFTPEADIDAWVAYDCSAESTLASTLTRDATSLSLVSAAAFLAASDTAPRAAFINPPDSDHAWERITYTGIAANTLTGVTRRSNVYWPPSGYDYPVGTTVSQWVNVTDLIVPDFQLPWTRREATAKWSVDLRGLKFNKELFERGNMFICQVQFYLDGSWGNWVVFYAGYIKETPNVALDGEDGNPFSMTVESIAQFVDAQEIPAHHFGKINVAKDKAVTVSSYLLDPTLAAGGEYFSSPSAEGKNMVDGSITTAWISEGIPKVTKNDPDFRRPETGVEDEHLLITEVYIPRPGYDDGYIWIELHNPHPSKTLSGNGLYLCNKNTVHAPLDYIVEKDGAHWQSMQEVCPPYEHFVIVPSLDVPPKGFLILCKDVTKFEEWWSVLGSADAVDWRTVPLTGGGLPIFANNANADDFTLDATSDFLQLRAASLNRIVDEVYWGDMEPTYVEAVSGYPEPYSNEFEKSARWTMHPYNATGPRPPVWREPANSDYDAQVWWQGAAVNPGSGISAGYSLRRSALARQDTSWIHSRLPTPGAFFSFPTGEHGSVDVGLIPTVLETDLAADADEAKVEGGTVGFTNSGSCQIGAETLTYTNKTGSDLTGLQTPHDPYPAGTPVYPVVNGVVQKSFPAVLLNVKRPQGRPYPCVFRLMGSNAADPRYPNAEEPEWEDDWEDILSGTRSTIKATIVASANSQGDPDAHVDSTNLFPNSGAIVYNGETIPYQRKDATTFYGLTIPHPAFTVGQFVYRQAQESTSNLSSNPFTNPLAYRHYMIIVYEMSDGGRARISEFEVIARNDEHTDGDGNDHTIDDATVGSLVKHILVTHYGLDASKLTIASGGDVNLVDQDLQKDSAGSLVDKLAAMTQCVLVYQLANGIIFKKDPQVQSGGGAAELMFVFERSNLESPVGLSFGSRLALSQVELYARNPVTGETLHVYWPTKPQQYGRRLVLRDVILLGNESDATTYAQAIFRRANFGSKSQMRPAGIGEWITPTMRLAIRWTQDAEENPYLAYREYFVTGVSWTVQASIPDAKVWLCDINAEERVV